MRRLIMLFVIGFLLYSGETNAQYLVNFESETKAAYASANVTLSGLSWNMTEALIGSETNDWKNGLKSARLRGYGTSAMTMLQDKENGIGNISFSYRRYGTDVQVDWKVEYSTNQGASWTQIGSVFTAPATNDVQTFNEVVNVTGDVRIRIIRATASGTQNRRLNIDDILITDFTGGGPVVAKPTFSHPGGTYFNPFNLEIACETENSTIYYTLNGDEPNNTSTEYTAPIPIDATKTVKAIAYAPEMSPSLVAEATYTFASVGLVSNIAELRAAYSAKNGYDYYKITGEVVLTFKQPFRNQKFIQDATAAILIDDLQGVITTNYNVGDGITGITGSFTYFGNMLQFNPAADPGAATSAGNVIVPEVITLNDFLVNFVEYESELVTIEGVSFSDIGSFFANGAEYTINDASKATAKFRTTFFDVNYIKRLIPQQPCDITGICNARAEGFFFTSRSIADFGCALPVVNLKITEIMYNSPESGTDTLEFIEIYNHSVAAVNMKNFTFSSGVTFTFPDYLFSASEYLVVSINAQAFMNTFGLQSYQWASGNLSNSGELIRLTDPFGNHVAAVTYSDSGLWPVEPDGEGPSLEFCDPSSDNNDPANWSFSTNLAAINMNGEGIYCTPGAGCNQNPALPVMYPTGWNGVSSNLLPARMSMEDLFAPALYNLVIIIAKDGIYWPGQNINSLGDWDTYKGYKAKFDGSTFFVFPGTEPEDRTITLQAGTHLLPVLSATPSELASVIMPLGTDIEFVFDIAGGLIYWPAGGIIPGSSTMSLSTLYPGFSYVIKTNKAVTIDFGVNPPKTFSENPRNEFVNSTTWNDVLSTGNQHIISIGGDALHTLRPGDIIGAFNAGGICTGMNIYTGTESVVPMVVQGDDLTTTAVDGMMTDEPISFKIYRDNRTLEVEAIYSSNADYNAGLFADNGLSVITGFKESATGIGDQANSVSISPNPSSGLFNLQVDGIYELTITNIHGQVVLSASADGTTTIDLTKHPKGVYLIRLNYQQQTIIQRIVGQ